MTERTEEPFWVSERSCPICGQGLLCVMRDGQTSVMHIACDDCGAVWMNPEKLDSESTSPRNTFSSPRLATRHEVSTHTWSRFVKNLVRI